MRAVGQRSDGGRCVGVNLKVTLPTAKNSEPYESRRFCTVLRGAGDEIPLAYSISDCAF